MNQSSDGHSTVKQLSRSWTEFWFGSSPLPTRNDWPRIVLAAAAFAFFASAFSDAAYWYAAGGAQSASSVSHFLVTAGLQDDSAWSWSPLFLVESTFIFYGVLGVGALLSVTVGAGRGGRLAASALWIVFVCVANRQLLLSGIAEKVLSLGLFALAIGPTVNPSDVWSTFSRRLMSVQITIFGVATFLAMASRDVWWNGTASFGLAAPTENRLIDWTTRGLANQTVHELLTIGLLFGLPLGLVLAWRPATNTIGKAVLIGFAVVVAILGSHWLYAMALIGCVLAISPARVKSASLAVASSE